MRNRLSGTFVALLLASAAVAAAEDRLAVLEFFGRIGCGNCAGAGQAISTLQRQYAGRAVLLEYSYDAFLTGRQDRFWATGVTANFLPLVMVGSGSRTSSGSTAYEQVYRSMLNAELARPPRAAIDAWWRRNGSALRVYAVATNHGEEDLAAGREAALWVIGYENGRVGHTNTWVWTTVRWALPYDLAPGESVTATIDTPPVSGPDWSRMAALVLAAPALLSHSSAHAEDATEIDPVVVDVARRYFWLPEDERLRIFTEDARRYVQRAGETYDIVIVDAYYSDSLPFHLTTDEFLREVRAVMAPDGVIAYNVISATEGDGSELFRSMYRTAEGVWDDLWVFPIGIGGDAGAGAAAGAARRNIIVLASDTRLPESELRARIADRVGGIVTIRDFEAMADDLYTQPVPVADVPLLTDAHAPVDSLIEVQ